MKGLCDSLFFTRFEKLFLVRKLKNVNGINFGLVFYFWGVSKLLITKEENCKYAKK